MKVSKLKNNELCVIVAQTPFQLFNAILVVKLASCTFDLWLIDKKLFPYIEICYKLKIFNNIFYAERNSNGDWSNSLVDKFNRLNNVIFYQKKIKYYLKSSKPSTICLFSDNHELTSSFSIYGKKHTTAKVVLIEEGCTVYFSPFRVKSNFLKSAFRYFLGIKNHNSYSIGWSPHIDTILVSLKDKIHPQLFRDREVIEWPRGPFPKFIYEIYLNFFDINILPHDKDVRIMYIGQPFHEVGLLSKKDEEKLILTIDQHRLANKCWIKPHPFEEIDKYQSCKNMRIFDSQLKNIPVEVLFYFLEPDIVVSYFSSAGLNYCIREKKPAIFYLPDSTPEYIRTLVNKNFKGLSKLLIVNNLDSISEAIDELLSKSPLLAEMEKDSDWQEIVNKITSPIC